MSDVVTECAADGLCVILHSQTMVVSTSTSISTTPQSASTPVTSTSKPFLVVVTITTPAPTSTAASDSQKSSDVSQHPNDTRVVATTIGVVGGLALLILLIYWAANHFANSRYQDEEYGNRDLEEDPTVSMLSATPKPLPHPAPPPLSRPKRASLLPYTRKMVTFERQQQRNSYNNHNNSKRFSDLLGRRLSAVHPGTRVLFGSPASKASKAVPARKPVPRTAGQPKVYAASGTESLYSDDDTDDASTVLGGTNRSHRNEEEFRPMPSGASFAKWLNAGRAQELPVPGSGPGL